MKQLLIGLACLLTICLMKINDAHSTGPYWQGLPAGQPTWQQWSPSYPTPVVAPSAYPETPMLALVEATDREPAYLYSLHKTKPSGIAQIYERDLLLQKRDWKTGKLVPAFGTNGTLSDVNSWHNHDPKSLVVGDDGYLYILYYDHHDITYRIQKRDPKTGALISSFGSGGTVTLGNINFQKLLALQGSGGLLIITDGLDGIYSAYFAKRYAYDNGAVIGSYTITVDKQWLTTTSFGDATIYNGNLYTAINIKSLTDQKYRITKTAAVSGTMIWEQTYTNPLFQKEKATSLAVDNSGVYLAGANTQDFIIFNVSDNFVRKYDSNNGNLVTGWGQDGGTVKIPFLSMFFQSVENLTLRVAENTLYLLNNGTSTTSFFIIPLSSSSSATLSRINKTTGVPDSSFADGGLAKVAKGKFPYMVLDKWGSIGIIGSDDTYTGDYVAKLAITPIPYGPLIDSGIRYKTASGGTVSIAAEPAGLSSSPLRIRKNNTTYSLPLVEPTAPGAAGILIQSPLGAKSLTKFN
jgi:hypothetical protein